MAQNAKLSVHLEKQCTLQVHGKVPAFHEIIDRAVALRETRQGGRLVPSLSLKASKSMNIEATDKKSYSIHSDLVTLS